MTVRPAFSWGQARSVVSCAALEARAKLDRVLDEILRPLLDADGGGIEVVSFDEKGLVLALTGAFRGDPGAPYVQQRVIRPAITKALGDVVITYAVR